MNPIFELNNKIAIVTGASKGIGKAIAMALGRQGATVVVSSRKQDAVDETATAFKHLGINAAGMACHMGDLAQVRHLISEVDNGDYEGCYVNLRNNIVKAPRFALADVVESEVIDRFIT